MARQLRVRVLVDFEVTIPEHLGGTPDASAIRDGIGATMRDIIVHGAQIARHGLDNEYVKASIAGVDIVDEKGSPVSSTAS